MAERGGAFPTPQNASSPLHPLGAVRALTGLRGQRAGSAAGPPRASSPAGSTAVLQAAGGAALGTGGPGSRPHTQGGGRREGWRRDGWRRALQLLNYLALPLSPPAACDRSGNSTAPCTAGHPAGHSKATSAGCHPAVPIHLPAQVSRWLQPARPQRPPPRMGFVTLQPEGGGRSPSAFCLSRAVRFGC